MAEYMNASAQNVAVGSNVLFADSIGCERCIYHRKGSGISKLKGITNGYFARFKVSFAGNLSIPTGGTAETISVSIMLDGEALPSTKAEVTPNALNAPFNAFCETIVEVPKGCCASVSVANTSAQAISVDNANMIVERI